MKKITLITAMLFIVVSFFAQTPQAFKYQTVVRDNAGEILANQNVSLRMTILQGALPGTVVYAETHTATTNEFGLVTLEIGRGTPITGSFSTINWATSPSYLKTELDPAGGTTYLIMGTSELLSVPYSLYSNSAGSTANFADSDGDTKVQVEKNPDEDVIRFDIGGVEKMTLIGNRLETGDDKRNIFIGKTTATNNNGTDNTVLGYNTLFSNQTGNENTVAGTQALGDNLDGSRNTAFGYRSMLHNVSGSFNTSIGFQTMTDGSGNYNSALGFYALLNNSGDNNTCLGSWACRWNYSGSNNTVMGNEALFWGYGGSNNVAIGTGAGFWNYGGSNNVSVGMDAGYWGGENNTALGYNAFYNNAGSSGVAIGNNAGYFENESNRLYIDNQARANLDDARNKALIYGFFDANPANQKLTFNANVGLGTTNPLNKLHVVATSNPLRLEGLQTSSGSDYLVVDNNGVVSKRTGTGTTSGWTLSGNTLSGSEVLGSANSFPIKFVTNNTEKMRITETGKVGIGTSTPDAKLTIGTPGATWNNFGITSDSRIGVVNGSGSRGAMIMESAGTYGILGAFNYATMATMPLVLEPDGGSVGINNISPVYKLDIYNTNLGSSAGNTSEWQRLAGSSGNYDQLRVFHRRHTAGSGWSTAEIRIQKTVDETDQNFISFKGGSTTSVGSLAFGFGNTEHILINSSGNIGIGNSDPQTKLHISATSNPLRLDGLQTTTYDNYLVVDATGVVSKRTGTGGGASGWALTGNTLAGTEKFGSINNYPVKFYTNNTERFRISETGNVGIGASNPTSNLHIYGDNTIPADPDYSDDVPLKISHVGQFLWQQYAMLIDNDEIQTVESDLYLNQHNGYNVNIAAGGGDVIIAAGGGNVGIGTESPSSLLEISGGNVTIVDGGNLGIGTETPSSRLDVRGNVTIREASTGAIAVELGTGLDYAEGFNISDEITAEPGTVLCIDPANEGELRISAEAYDYRVAGIVAGANGLGSGIKLGSGEFDYDVALAGRVYCNVITTNEEIIAGDLLTTSDTPGFAMKVKDFDKAKGAILGKAMESLKKNSQGQILVLVTLQ